MLWLLEDILTAPVPDTEEVFGLRVAISNDVAVISAPGAAAPEFQSGAVYVFRLEPLASEWRFETQLTASDGDFGDIFGMSVSIDRDVVLIGARNDENDGVFQAGSAYVFRFDGTSWVEETKLVDPDGETFDLFGFVVSINGDLAIVGAPGNMHPDGSDGSAFVFRHDGTAWVLEAELAPFDAIGTQIFGGSVSIVGDVAVVGASRDNNIGAAYVFRHDGSQWIDEAKLTPSDSVGEPRFGAEVSLNAATTTLLVGAPFDSTMGFEAGACWVFRYEGDAAWTEIAKLTASDAASSDNFGISVSLDQDIAVIAAPQQSANFADGAAYVFAGLSGIDCDGNETADACDLFDGTATDANTNGVPDECEAIGDLNGDGTVGIVDFLMLLAAWGPCQQPCPPSCSGDLNGSCNVDGLDFLELLMNWSHSDV